MCFHSKQSTDAQQLKKRFKAAFPKEAQHQPSEELNGFKHPYTPVITNAAPDEIQLLQWGLLPHWAKTRTHQGNTLNAKIETLSEKPSFREVIHQRCLVIADGFYEWKWLDGKGTKKEKYLITTADNPIFTMAGLWSTWSDPLTGELRQTYTILTTEANTLMAEIHNSRKRMPVILSREGEQAWLNGQNAPQLEPHLVAKNLEDLIQVRLF